MTKKTTAKAITTAATAAAVVMEVAAVDYFSEVFLSFYSDKI